MTDADVAVTKLRIEVESKDAATAAKNLDNLVDSGSEASKAASSLRASWLPAVAAITTAATAAAFLGEMLYEGAVAASEQKAKITALLHESGAVAAQFERLVVLGSDLKNGLEEATDAYVYLRSRGLKPTSEAITAYASVAAHYGESTMAMLEAVERATTGKFSALEKFGIEMVQHGDKIRVTSQGITRDIDATTHSVQNYLIDLGKTQFADTLEEQGRSITATLSDIASEVGNTFTIIAHHTGTDNALEDLFTEALESMKEFNAYLVDGGLERDIAIFIVRVQGSMEDLVDKAKAHAGAFVDSWLVELSYLSEQASIRVDSIMGIFSGGEGSTDTDTALKEAGERRVEDLKEIKTNLDDQIEGIEDSRDAVNRALMLLPNLHQLGAPDESSATEQLPDSVIESKAKPRKAGRVVDTSARELEQLERSLQTQEERVGASYFRRLEIIKKHTSQGSAQQLELSERLIEQTQIELSTMAQQRSDDLSGFLTQLKDAEQLLEESFQERRRIILENTEVTEDQRLALMTQAEMDYAARQRQLEVQRQRVTLKLAGDFFGNISAIAAVFGSKGAKIAKAAAIVQTTIKMYESATSAYAAMAGIPYVGPALGVAAAGAAIAAGAANIAAIKAQPSYVGAFATGGHIPYGSRGMAGEAGPEFIDGPADITSARSTRDMLKNASGSSVSVQIFNLPGQTARVEKTTTDSGPQLRVIIEAVESRIASDIRVGKGAVSSALGETFNLSRV